MKQLLIVFICTALLLFQPSAWAASTKDEVIALREQVAEMQKELAEIKKLLEEGAKAPAAAAPSQPGFRPQEMDIGSSPFKGEVDAPVTLVEYSDYQCPFCARNYREVLPVLEREYIDTGKLKFVMRENPLPQLHKDAMNASMAALCAGDQDQYWPMHNLLFDNQRQLSVDNLKQFAADLGLDTGRFNECLDSKAHEKTVQRDLASGAKLGVRGTPGFVLGLTDPEDPRKANLSVFIRGAQSIDQFRASIEDLLSEAE